MFNCVNLDNTNDDMIEFCMNKANDEIIEPCVNDAIRSPVV